VTMIMQVDTYDDFKVLVNEMSCRKTRTVMYAQGGCILAAFIGDKMIQVNPYNIETMNGGNEPTQLVTDFPERVVVSFRPLFWLSTDASGLTGGPATW